MGYLNLSDITPAEVALSSQNLSNLERSVLEAVVTHKAKNSVELSELLGNRQIVISTVLKKLSGKGLLFREKDPTKRRGFNYATTKSEGIEDDN